MLMPLTGVVSGILLACGGASLWSALLLISCGVAIYILLTYKLSDPVKSYSLNKCHHVWILVIFGGIGIMSYDLDRPYILKNDPGEYTYAYGRITDIRHTTSGDRAVVSVITLTDKSGNVCRTENMKLQLRSDAMGAVIGDNVLFPVHLSRIKDPDNYFTTGYAARMNNKGIYYETRCNGKEIITTGHSASIGSFAAHCRDRIEASIEKCALKKETRYFLITILLGDRAYLDPHTRDLFADAGISHILALSGMHVAIIGGIFLWLLFPINFMGLYRYRLLLSALLLVIYALLTGFAPSTVRATLMMATMVTCVFMERKNSAWNALLLSTFIILLVSPAALFDPGMQLSFICVASLIFFVRPLTPVGRRNYPMLYRVYTLVISSVVATAGTWCLCARYFGSVPILFLPANILTLPLLPGYLVIAVVYLFLDVTGIASLPYVKEIAETTGFILDYGYYALERSLAILTSDGTSALEFSPTLLTTILWFVFLGVAALCLNEKKNNYIKWGCGALALAFAVSVATEAKADANEAFIIQKDIRTVSVLYRQHGRRSEKTVSFKRKTVSSCRMADKHIINVDCQVNTESGQYTVTSGSGDCDILLLSGGIRQSLQDILKTVSTSEVVIHPTVRKKREAKLIAEADSLGIPCHSIRRDGPYRYIKR